MRTKSQEPRANQRREPASLSAANHAPFRGNTGAVTPKTALRHSALCVVHCVLWFVFWLALAGCTRNGGDIGPWFGTWAIDSVTVDGQELTLDPLGRGSAYYLQFQRSVVCLRYTDELHDGGESYGTWTDAEDAAGHRMLLVTFDRNNYDIHLMPLYNTFFITSATGRNVVLQDTQDEGRQVVYYLTKQ